LCLGILQRTVINIDKHITSYHYELLQKLLYLTLELMTGYILYPVINSRVK